MIIAALIFVVSIAFLGQFFLAYCRSLIAESFRLELSPQAHEVTGIDDHKVNGEDFRRLLQLVHLCPSTGRDTMELRAVGAYYGFLNLLRSSVGAMAPAVASWAERERQGCGYFAAVTLDRRIAHNRGLLADHMANRI